MRNDKSTGMKAKLALFAVASPLVIYTVPTYAEVRIGGYAREAVSVNLQNPIETPENDRGDISMLRSTVRIDLEAEEGPVAFVAKVRADKEVDTSYLKRLARLGANSAAGEHLSDQYSGVELREAYVDLKLGERASLRLGKQQVVLGETDFFQALDVVHGFDYTWRSFLEPANDELRKPLIMANATVKVPEADGALQVFVRPGWDRRKDIGNTYDLFGGRWANQPNRGTDLLKFIPYDLDNPAGNYKSKTGGVRWSGTAADINYSLSVLRTFNPDPVVNPKSLFPGANMSPLPGTVPSGALGNLVYPMINAVGLTASGYASSVDAVFSTELAYLHNYAFNHGYTNAVGLPGFNGAVQKNVVRSMVRMDKNLPGLSFLLEAEKPAFFSVQIFDTWIRQFDANEDIVNLAGFGQARKRHSVTVTTILGLSYLNGQVQPQLVAGADATYGGGFVVPSVAFQLSKNWMLKTELDLFWNRGNRNAANAATERSTALFGYFNKNNQLYSSLTYQF